MLDFHRNGGSYVINAFLQNYIITRHWHLGCAILCDAMELGGSSCGWREVSEEYTDYVSSSHPIDYCNSCAAFRSLPIVDSHITCGIYTQAPLLSLRSVSATSASIPSAPRSGKSSPSSSLRFFEPLADIDTDLY